jgi:hypothetical protein
MVRTLDLLSNLGKKIEISSWLSRLNGQLQGLGSNFFFMTFLGHITKFSAEVRIKKKKYTETLKKRSNLMKIIGRITLRKKVIFQPTPLDLLFFNVYYNTTQENFLKNSIV